MVQRMPVARDAVIKSCGKRKPRRHAVVDPIAPDAVSVGLLPGSDDAGVSPAENQCAAMKVDKSTFLVEAGQGLGDVDRRPGRPR